MMWCGPRCGDRHSLHPRALQILFDERVSLAGSVSLLAASARERQMAAVPLWENHTFDSLPREGDRRIIHVEHTVSASPG